MYLVIRAKEHRMPLPEVPTGHYLVIHAEFATGIVCNRSGQRQRVDNEEQPVLFPSHELTHAYAQHVIMEQPHLECNIFNDQQERLDRIWNTVYWDMQRQQKQTQRKWRWWQIWKR